MLIMIPITITGRKSDRKWVCKMRMENTRLNGWPPLRVEFTQKEKVARFGHGR